MNDKQRRNPRSFIPSIATHLVSMAMTMMCSLPCQSYGPYTALRWHLHGLGGQYQMWGKMINMQLDPGASHGNESYLGR
jgi:hypothetical protein